MIILTNETQWGYTPSDNSHLFGVPVRIVEGYVTLVVPMTRQECFQRIDAGVFIPFIKAGIDIRCEYIKEE